MIDKFITTKAFPTLFMKFERMTDRNQIELTTSLLKYVTPSLSATKTENLHEGRLSNKLEIKVTYEDFTIEKQFDDIDFKEISDTED